MFKTIHLLFSEYAFTAKFSWPLESQMGQGWEDWLNRPEFINTLQYVRLDWIQLQLMWAILFFSVVILEETEFKKPKVLIQNENQCMLKTMYFRFYIHLYQKNIIG